MSKDQHTARNPPRGHYQRTPSKGLVENKTTFRAAVDESSTPQVRPAEFAQWAKFSTEESPTLSPKTELCNSRGICTSDGSEDFDETELFESISHRRSRLSIKRDYEFVESVQKVLALDDDEDSASDDDWEAVYANLNSGISTERSHMRLL
ncbi:hypothetical protein BKA70DRAFT_1220423 [Coprinopsis sp. MPI-PUGE-AT-0042]|nr:hypothetical protein BKA70DRAFT_1220423 [Coprinopsis sp. MPI-PUGE-AT-0042]